ncbi:MAG: alanine racemase, partial [Flavobacteriaceae bacterium]|nr:alanine racemase [Flavobacteriaceae bacterium]
DSIEALAKRISQANNLNLKGFLGHAGQTYNCRDPKQIEAVHQEAKSKLVMLTQSFLLDYPGIIASYGDTPSSSICKDFDGITEIRPGNFVFYDLMQVQIGACDSSQIAVAMACPVVAIHPWNFEIVIYGGGIHFSKDRMESDHGSVFGKIIRFSPDGFGTVIPDCYVRNLSQEHGIIKASEEMINQTKIGDLLYVLPVHSCMTANLMKQYLTTDGRTIEMFNPF